MFPSVQLKKTVLLRLSKILSLSSVTSRNKAHELIKNNRVKVNKQIINQNVFVDANSDIEIDDIPIHIDLTTRLWGIYKPKYVFCNTENNYQYEEQKEIIENIKKLKNEKIQATNYLIGNNNSSQEITRNNRHTKEIEQKEIEKKQLEKKQIDKKQIEKKLVPKLESSSYNIKKTETTKYTIQHSTQNNVAQNGTQISTPSLKTENNVKRKEQTKLNMNIFDFIRKKNILYEEKCKTSHFIPEHLITINSLDASSEGLVFFTNDGDFANNLKSVENKILTCYLLKIQGELTSEKLQRLQKGTIIDNNVFVKPLSIDIVKSNFSNNWIKFTYVEKSKIYLDCLFTKYNLNIKKCKRISFGPYRASDLSTDFFMPLKIHSMFVPFIPTYKAQWVLTQPNGNLPSQSTHNGQNKILYIKDYFKQSLLFKENNYSK